MWLSLLWACGAPPDPELVARRDALARWEEGRARLEAGDPVAARSAFAAARALRDDPLLGGWEAKALADGGDPAAAAALAEEVLRRAPELAILRYDRAAWLARAGRPEEAGTELQRALAEGAGAPHEALEDPDFGPFLDHPAFGFLPRRSLLAALDPVPPTAFWGTEVPVRLRLTGALGAPITVSPREARGPVRLVGVVEERSGSGAGGSLDLTWTWVVEGAGDWVVGPLEVAAGPHRAEVPAFAVRTDAPPERQAAVETLSLPVPSTWMERVPPRAVRTVDGGLWIRALASDRVEVEPALPPPLRLERRGPDGGAEVLRVWGPGVTARRVRLLGADGAVLHDGPP